MCVLLGVVHTVPCLLLLSRLPACLSVAGTIDYQGYDQVQAQWYDRRRRRRRTSRRSKTAAMQAVSSF